MNKDQKKLLDLNSDKKAFVFIFFSIILIYWPVSFFVYNFKWDMVDLFLAWRYHVSLSIVNLELPLWNAHQSGGYPIHGDPQSGAFYPIVWILVLLFGKYSIISLHIEFILTALIAAGCFYKLCRFFSVSIPLAALAGIMYACSGIFVGNTQHLSWLISAAYLPGILYCFFSLSKSLHYKYIFYLGFLSYLILSGGYPAFDIILMYILLIFFIYYAIQQYKALQLKKYILLCSSAVLISLLFSSVILYSIYLAKPYINRGEGVSLAVAMQNAFTLPSFLSFILPFATCKHVDIIKTDISMSNAYIGLFFLLSLLVYIVSEKKTTLEKIILGIAISCLLISVGEILPFRKWIYYALPFMNYFRLPSTFRIFVVIFLLLLSAIQMEKLKNDFRKYQYIVFSASVLFSLIIIISIVKNYSGTSIKDYFNNLSFFDAHSTIYDHIIIQSIVQLIILSTFFAFSFITNKKSTTLLYGFILLDIYISVHMNLPYTSLDYKADPLVLNKKISPLPGITYIPKKQVALNNDYDNSLSPLWKNLNDFKLEIAYDGWNAFELRSYFSFSESKFFPIVIKNYPIYLVKKYINISDTAAINLNTQSEPKIALVENNYYKKTTRWKNNPEDTCKFISISGNKIAIECFVKDTSTLAIFQNLMPGWTCQRNKIYQQIEPINMSLMGISLPPGKSLVELEYRPKGLSISLYISIISQVISMFLLSYLLVYKK